MADIKYEPHVDDQDESPQPPAYSAPPEATLPPYVHGAPGAPGAPQPVPQYQPYVVPGAMDALQPVPQYQPYLQQPCQPTTAVIIRNTHIIAPPSYMVWSILSCFFCCWPLGIVAIIKSSEVNNLIAMGDFARANIVSREAKNWNIAAVVGGIITVAVCLGVPLILGMFAGATEQGGYYSN